MHFRASPALSTQVTLKPAAPRPRSKKRTNIGIVFHDEDVGLRGTLRSVIMLSASGRRMKISAPFNGASARCNLTLPPCLSTTHRTNDNPIPWPGDRVDRAAAREAFEQDLRIVHAETRTVVADRQDGALIVIPRAEKRRCRSRPWHSATHCRSCPRRSGAATRNHRVTSVSSGPGSTTDRDVLALGRVLEILDRAAANRLAGRSGAKCSSIVPLSERATRSMSSTRRCRRRARRRITVKAARSATRSGAISAPRRSRSRTRRGSR